MVEYLWLCLGRMNSSIIFNVLWSFLTFLNRLQMINYSLFNVFEHIQHKMIPISSMQIYSSGIHYLGRCRLIARWPNRITKQESLFFFCGSRPWKILK